jgi:hypothetical protein
MSAGQFGGKFYWTRLTPTTSPEILKQRQIVFGTTRNEPILIAAGFQSTRQIINKRSELVLLVAN